MGVFISNPCSGRVKLIDSCEEAIENREMSNRQAKLFLKIKPEFIKRFLLERIFG
jgi:hypothetical protein